ncbi:hypothetical protein ACEWY4_007200 [Coilia grayii]|uniref:Cystatin fetuin-A-type domain-containing protein n=1 Tax=Coilia grayii TaxID=363190 RepID=A0ABD1KFS1_9TELE
MRILCVFLGVLVVRAWALVLPTITMPPCDSPEAEMAAGVFQDYINAQRTSGFKYALNQIDEIKIIGTPNMEIYKMEIELLETKCHVLDPAPVTACPVRTKAEIAVEADCDVALTKTGGVLTVIEHRCKSEPETSTEDICVGCPHLLPLNDTNALQMTTASLAVFNSRTANVSLSKYAILEVGRLTTQVVSGAPKLFSEYVIVETNCTTTEDDNCVPLNQSMATYGFCTSGNVIANVSVDCRIFAPQQPVVEPAQNGTIPLLMIDMTGQLSAESVESLDPVKQASIISIVKRQAPAAGTVAPGGQSNTMPVPVCPGKVKFF